MEFFDAGVGDSTSIGVGVDQQDPSAAAARSRG